MLIQRPEQIRPSRHPQIPGRSQQGKQKIGLAELCAAGVRTDEYLDNIVLLVKIGIIDAVEFLIGDGVNLS